MARVPPVRYSRLLVRRSPADRHAGPIIGSANSGKVTARLWRETSALMPNQSVAATKEQICRQVDRGHAAAAKLAVDAIAAGERHVELFIRRGCTGARLVDRRHFAFRNGTWKISRDWQRAGGSGSRRLEDKLACGGAAVENSKPFELETFLQNPILLEPHHAV
jgi:hypothetical protein